MEKRGSVTQAMRLFIVRHGETAWNREGRFQGQLDVPLNEAGLLQADRVAERFRGYPLAAVLTSPLSRARVTGERIFEAADCDALVVDDGFQEINHGAWEGVTTDEVARRDGDLLKLWRTDPQRVTMPGAGGESLADVGRRAVEALERVALGKYEGDVLLATHDAVGKVLICHYIGLPLTSYWRIRIPNCGVSCLDFGDDGPQLSLLGDVSHLGCGFESFLSKSL